MSFRQMFVALLALGAAACGSGRDTDSASRTAAYGGVAHVIPGLIEVEDFDAGPPGVAYQDEDKENLGVDYRGATEVDIEGRADASNGHGVGWTRAGEWLAYTVDVTEAGRYAAEFQVSSGGLGGVFHLEVDGVDVSGPIEVANTGGFDRYALIETEAIELEDGRMVLKLVMDSKRGTRGIADFDYMRFWRIN